MIRPIKYFLLLIAYPSLLHPQVIDKMEVSRNIIFSDSEIRSWGQVGEGTKIYEGILDTMKSRISFRLSLRGYFHPDFTNTDISFSPDSQKASIVLSVDEGEPTYMNKIHF